MTSLYGYSSSYSHNSRYTEIKPRDRDQPLDTISCLMWDPFSSDPACIAGSWDGHVRYYIPKFSSGGHSSGELDMPWHFFFQQPVLSIDMAPDNVLLAGLASGDIAAVDMRSNKAVRVGGHDAPICGVFWLREKGIIMSLGFDNLVRFWNLDENTRPEHEVQLPLKTHTCAMEWPYLLIGSAESTITVVTLKNLPNVSFPRRPEDYYKAGIQKFSKFTCSRILSEAKRVILGTVDGRALNMSFRETYDNFSYSDQMVTRHQKNSDVKLPLYGQVDCVDIGYYNYETFSLIGGS
jgi:WD40 repeat protein